MHLINLIETGDEKNCPKPGCGKPEYVTRRSAGRTLSICPNGHSWDPIEVVAQRQKHERATKEESIFSSNYDFLRQQTIIKEPARPRNDGVFRSPYPTFVDPLKEDESLKSQYRRHQRELRELEGLPPATPTIKMSRETLRGMEATGYFGPRQSPSERLLGVPIVLDETIPPGLFVWSVGVEFENPFERFLKAMTNEVAKGFGLSPLAFKE